MANGVIVTGNGKALKITSLVALFVGLATVALGAMISFADVSDIDAWATLSEGLCATVYGVRTAILANVPSNTSKIRTKALILTAFAVCVIAFLLLGGRQVEIAQISLAATIAVIALAADVLSHSIVREQLRK